MATGTATPIAFSECGVPTRLKLCTKCKRMKPFASFGRAKSRSNGITVHCRMCRSTGTRRVRPTSFMADCAVPVLVKRCTGCNRAKPLSRFSTHLQKPDGLNTWCKLCDCAAQRARVAVLDEGQRAQRRTYQAGWRQENAERLRPVQAAERRRVREAAIAAYGGKCACCGEQQIEFLAIDHIGGRGVGAAHRKELWPNRPTGGTGQDMYRWLRRNGYPEGFRVLCHNCNCADGFYGYCPHQTEE